MVESIATMIAPQARAKQLDLLTYVDPSVPPVVIGDGLRLGTPRLLLDQFDRWRCGRFGANQRCWKSERNPDHS